MPVIMIIIIKKTLICWNLVSSIQVGHSSLYIIKDTYTISSVHIQWRVPQKKAEIITILLYNTLIM